MNALPQAIATGAIHSGTMIGEVERRDAGDDAERLAHRVRVDAAGDLRRGLALEQVAEPAGELDHLEAAVHLAARVGEHLAVLARDQRGELVAVGVDELAEREQHLRCAWRATPRPTRRPAFAAAWTARSTSAAVANGTRATTSPVAGSLTSPWRSAGASSGCAGDPVVQQSLASGRAHEHHRATPRIARISPGPSRNRREITTVRRDFRRSPHVPLQRPHQAPARRAPGPARRATPRAARRPPSARRPRSPCSATKSASAPSRRARMRAAARSSAARCASSASASSSMPGHRRRSTDTATTGVALAPSERSAAREVAPRARADLAEVGLGDDQHVGHLHDPGLQELQRVAGPGLDDDGDGVGRLGDLGLGLADADGLDHDDVERGGERLRGGAGGGGEAAEALARGHRADEHAAVGRVVLDPRAVAEQRAARALGGRVDREHGDRAAARAPLARERRQQRRLAGARRPGDADDVRVRLAAEPPGRDLGEQRRDLAAPPGERFSSRFSAAGAARQVARAQARAELGAGHAAERTPWRSATSATIVAHDPGELEVLRRVTRRRRPPRAAPSTSASGMIPPTTTGMSAPPASRSAVDHVRDQLAVRAREDREADHVHALVDRRAGDLRRRQPDALVDDVHAGVAGAHGDLLGAVGVPVEAGLADEDLQRAPERLADARDLVAQLHQLLAAAGAAASPTPVGAR